MGETDLEETQYVGYHDWHGAGRCTDHSHHSLRLGDDGRTSAETLDISWVFLNQCLNKCQWLFQSMGVPGAGVQDTCPQGDIRQQLIVVIDTIQGKQHGLQPMDPFLLLQLATGFAVVSSRVHWEQPTQRYVPIDAYWIEVRVAWHFGFGSQGDQETTSQQQHPAADTSVAANPRSLKASSQSHNERLNLHPNTNSSPLKMKEVCTHIPTHTYKCPEGKPQYFSERSRLQKPLLMVSNSDTNSVILIMQPRSLYLLHFLLSTLCFARFLHLRVAATCSN